MQTQLWFGLTIGFVAALIAFMGYEFFRRRARGENPPPPANVGGGAASTGRFTILQGIFGGLVFVVLLIIIIAFWKDGGAFLESLQSLEISRGLITFLVVFTTIVIAITLVLYITISTADPAEIKDRFGFGKEILTALIGILGTILGFYFGQSVPGPSTMQVTPVYISNVTPKVAELVTLTYVATGGKPPYTYSISFNPDLIPAIPEKASPQGVIQEEIKIPSDKLPKDKDTTFNFKIVVKDSTGKSVTYEEKTKTFTVKAEEPKKAADVKIPPFLAGESWKIRARWSAPYFQNSR